jgi:hypothetical protein
MLKPDLSSHGNSLKNHLRQLEEPVCWISDENLLSYNSTIWLSTVVSMSQLLGAIKSEPDLDSRLFIVSRETESWRASALNQARLNGLRKHRIDLDDLNALGKIHTLDFSEVDHFSDDAVTLADYFVMRSDQLIPTLSEIQRDGLIPSEFDVEAAMRRKKRRSPSLRSTKLVTRLIDPLFPISLSDFSIFYSRLAATGYPHLSPNTGLLQYVNNRSLFRNRRSHILAFFRHLVFNFRVHLTTLLARGLSALGV